VRSAAPWVEWTRYSRPSLAPGQVAYLAKAAVEWRLAAPHPTGLGLSRLRILYIVNEVGPGGTEAQLRDRAVALVRRGHKLAVVSMMPFKMFEQELKDAGVETFTLNARKGSSRSQALADYLRILRNFRPDVVHAHLFYATMLTRLARVVPARLRGGPSGLVCSSHSTYEPSDVRYLAYRVTSRLGDAWACVTREGIEIHEKHRAVRVGDGRFMPNGVDLTRFRPDAVVRGELRESLQVGDAFVWLAVGSFHDEFKDYGTLLHAFKDVPRSLLLIAGHGRLLEEKRALAASLGIADRVRFLGFRTDVERLLQAADAFVMSSHTEGMPNVLLQAAASGVPAVTTDVGEAAGIIEHGVGGKVVPPRRPHSLARAMREVESIEPQARTAMSRATRARVAELFDFDRAVDRWESLYREVYGRRLTNQSMRRSALPS
jgi:glycosyltransferase involved in cell wall biosynthesis